MRYYVKSKFFKLKEDFWVKDKNNNDKFFIDKEFLSFGLQFKVIENNQCKYKVNEKLLKFLPSYEVFDNSDRVVATVKKELTFFKHSVNVESSYGEFKIEGDFWQYNYVIKYQGNIIANINKEFLAFTDNYYVDINFHDEAFVLALVIVIDNIIDKGKSN